MKRTPLARKTPLRAKPKLSKPRKPLPKVNPRQVAKRKKSYARKLAAYRRSEVYRLVEMRSGGLCEHYLWTRMGNVVRLLRCRMPAEQHHHLSYARFGGRELQSDVIAVCKSCHDLLEVEHPTRRRRY